MVDELKTLIDSISDCWISFIVLLIIYSVLLYKLFVYRYNERLKKLKSDEEFVNSNKELLKEINSSDYKFYKANLVNESGDGSLAERDWF